MFAIYDTEGLRFRDTLEKLRQVQPTPAAARLNLKSTLTRNENQHQAQTANATTSKNIVSHQAQQAYKAMLHLNQREPIVHAWQLMSQPVVTIAMEIDILAAHRFFQTQHFQQMPVVNTSQRLVGIVSVQDLLQFIMIDGEQIHYVSEKHVSDAMSSKVITADPVSDIRRVASLMQEFELQAVPIVDQHDALLGIVSRSDILGALINEPPLSIWS